VIRTYWELSSAIDFARANIDQATWDIKKISLEDANNGANL
jgi:hypothetical protein